jgi:hypothetical protein
VKKTECGRGERSKDKQTKEEDANDEQEWPSTAHEWENLTLCNFNLDYLNKYLNKYLLFYHLRTSYMDNSTTKTTDFPCHSSPPLESSASIDFRKLVA